MSGAAAEYLQRIYAARGDLTPPAVVEEATPADHPLHSYFEWDDTIGGHQNRLRQAAELIRSVRVVYQPTPAAKAVSVRAYVSVPAAGEDPATPQRHYVATRDAMSDDFMSKQVLRDFEGRIRSLRKQYGHLAEFREVVQRELLGDVG